MKKILLAVLISFLSVSSLSYGEALKTDASVEVEAGDADNDAVLADSGGNVYVEFSSRTRVVYESDKMLFTGEILAPAVIDQPGKSPRPRMREVISFEIRPDTGDDILFVDRLNTLHQANRIREKYTNPEGLVATARVKLIVPINDPNIGYPKLWEYISDEEGWSRVGGKLEESSTDGVRIFSASLSNSGVFTIFDEAPSPTEFAQYQEELYPEENMQGEDIPFQSGDDEIFLDEGELPDDLLVDTESEFIDDAALLLAEDDGLIPGVPGEDEIASVPAVGEVGEEFSDVFKEVEETEPGVINLETGEAEEASVEEEIFEEDSTETLGEDADLEPPADGDLPQTGAEESSVSFLFPFIAFFVLGTLFASAWVAFRKER